jgi:hypothetical protein
MGKRKEGRLTENGKEKVEKRKKQSKEKKQCVKSKCRRVARGEHIIWGGGGDTGTYPSLKFNYCKLFFLFFLLLNFSLYFGPGPSNVFYEILWLFQNLRQKFWLLLNYSGRFGVL